MLLVNLASFTYARLAPWRPRTHGGLTNETVATRSSTDVRERRPHLQEFTIVTERFVDVVTPAGVAALKLPRSYLNGGTYAACHAIGARATKPKNTVSLAALPPKRRGRASSARSSRFLMPRVR